MTYTAVPQMRGGDQDVLESLMLSIFSKGFKVKFCELLSLFTCLYVVKLVI